MRKDKTVEQQGNEEFKTTTAKDAFDSNKQEEKLKKQLEEQEKEIERLKAEKLKEQQEKEESQRQLEEQRKQKEEEERKRKEEEEKKKPETFERMNVTLPSSKNTILEEYIALEKKRGVKMTDIVNGNDRKISKSAWVAQAIIEKMEREGIEKKVKEATKPKNAQ